MMPKINIVELNYKQCHFDKFWFIVVSLNTYAYTLAGL